MKHDATNRPLVYLACPYSDDDPKVRFHRYVRATKKTALLIGELQDVVYSPVTYSHAMCDLTTLDPLDSHWYAVAETFLRLSHKMIVLMLPGWRESNGVQAEIKIAQEMGIPVEYMEA